MRLYIAEKPSLGRAIADALPGPHQRRQGSIQCGNGQVVSWCIGHLLEPVEPENYNPDWKRWRLDTLPIMPTDWRLQPRNEARNQLQVLESLIEQASEIVHAGDPDREGQLLVDEVLSWCQTSKPVQRVLINDLTPTAVQKALSQETSNRRFAPLRASAQARQQADWLYGINLSRGYTLYHQQQGQEGVFSVGRVQTPVLGLVVQRDNAIRDFRPRAYFELEAALSPRSSEESLFKAKWQPGENQHEHRDEEGRMLQREPVEAVLERIKGATGEVRDASFRERPEAPPLPLSLSVLQITAARRYGMGAQAVLETAQSLYEKHQLITYPRSDCRYLPEGHWTDRHEVLAAIASNHPELVSEGVPSDPDRYSKAWDDARVEAHHAIIPTQRRHPIQRLSQQEAAVYDLIARFYLMQFEADAVHREGTLECVVAGERFRARETGVLEMGWKRLEPVRRRQDDAERQQPPLPRLEKGTALTCHDGRIQEKQTRPPAPFTDATLLSAMTGIARFVQDQALRRTLRETDGLGTEATRAHIIQTLFRREFLYREGRAIHATEKGQALIAGLPEQATTPDMTATWEARLETIRQGDEAAETFLQQLGSDIHRLLEPVLAASAQPAAADTGIHCPQCRAPMRQRSGKYGDFWSCSRFPQCRGTRPIENDGPASDGMDQPPIPCPSCMAPLVRREGKKGAFWGCSRFPGCRTTLPDLEGKPDMRGKT